MRDQNEARTIIHEMNDRVRCIFPEDTIDVVLFGSYARNEAEDGSDIDVMYLVNASREEIAKKNWQIGEAASQLLLEYGIVISPIVVNRTYYEKYAHAMPFFRNIKNEGVRLSA